jgi:uncharacterized membrane protein
MKRIDSIDFTRGMIMIIMALDHVRDMMHVSAIGQSPTNLAVTTPALFFTRWITYLCAPTFVFLAGTSAYLLFRNQNDAIETRRFLFTRGIWLIILEFTLVNFGLYFDLGLHNFIFEVIATIGFGFIITGLLIKLKPGTLAWMGLAIIATHNLFPLIPFGEDSIMRTILSPLFNPGGFVVTSGLVFIMAYPPIPWLGIMLVGFGAGRLFELPEETRKELFRKIGVGCLMLFVVIRFLNVYGDSFPWAKQKGMMLTFLSFMNVTKYPPSLLFCLITLGIMFFILSWAEGADKSLLKLPVLFGKVPMFYFLTHFYLIHISLLILLAFQGFGWNDWSFATGTFGRPQGVESGVSLGAVYAIWIAVVASLYLPCRWYGRLKAENKHWWLKYL